MINITFTGRSVASSAEDNLTKDDIVPGTFQAVSDLSS